MIHFQEKILYSFSHLASWGIYLYALFIFLYAGKLTFNIKSINQSAGSLFSTFVVNFIPSETVCKNLFSDRFLNKLIGFIKVNGLFPNEFNGTVSFYIS